VAAAVVAVGAVVVAGVSTSGTSDGVTSSRLKGSWKPAHAAVHDATRQPSLGGGLGGLVFSVVPA
jgi:cysteine synthase